MILGTIYITLAIIIFSAAVYLVVRLASAAWFQSKADYIKEIRKAKNDSTVSVSPS